ncbi:Pimeloyl-ACP methyl ester carboxylesterase [Nitrosomonas sp. Nm51]|uniref:alpha/beta fold hydrolase n=1 Tax=Nitrosomonas sp. Nm51 TaxID=133720 RepID=UPI0008D7DA2D|nr:alpha/beta hydrolase [Nitrosomonas sp. Nm51]SER43273.1 Pimeloyl-ACP methyl ester carboxylesterase [Nitrosomonas sp. Nm51]
MGKHFKKLLVPTLSADGTHKKPHHIAYMDWGDMSNQHIVFCVHGLTRNCRDFDYLASDLSSQCRIICPDVVGRGQSDWLEDERDYDYYPVYLSDAAALVRHIQGQYSSTITIDWVGISMGGLIGMMTAIDLKDAIRRMVISDIGPLIPVAALKRMSEYVGKGICFKDLESFEAYIRKISAPFGPLTDAQWRHLTIHSARLLGDGTYTFYYDPKISASFKEHALQNDVDLWQYWDILQTPTLVIRGDKSDVLLAETAAQMQQRGPHATVINFPGIGHAPILLDEKQISIVKDFLLS